jgi:hypothetical protein
MKIARIQQCYICGRKIFIEVAEDLQKRSILPKFNIVCWECMSETGRELAGEIFKVKIKGWGIEQE